MSGRMRLSAPRWRCIGNLGLGFWRPCIRRHWRLSLHSAEFRSTLQSSCQSTTKGVLLPCSYEPDFLCFGNIIVELKALQVIGGVEEAQVLNYLKATRVERGLLLNFGRPSLEFKRLIFSNPRKQAQT
jgi:GxxExxY protein